MVECFDAITIDAKHLYFKIRSFETLSSFCIFEKALFLDTRDSILETRDSILERFEHRGSSIESRGSSFECQLTFERYCISIENNYMKMLIILLFCYICCYLLNCYYIVICCLILYKTLPKPYISIENNYMEMLQLKRLKMNK